jgi:hypothetical protein
VDVYKHFTDVLWTSPAKHSVPCLSTETEKVTAKQDQYPKGSRELLPRQLGALCSSCHCCLMIATYKCQQPVHCPEYLTMPCYSVLDQNDSEREQGVDASFDAGVTSSSQAGGGEDGATRSGVEEFSSGLAALVLAGHKGMVRARLHCRLGTNVLRSFQSVMLKHPVSLWEPHPASGCVFSRVLAMYCAYVQDSLTMYCP